MQKHIVSRPTTGQSGPRRPSSPRGRNRVDFLNLLENAWVIAFIAALCESDARHAAAKAGTHSAVFDDGAEVFA